VIFFSFLTRYSYAVKRLWHGLSSACLSVVCDRCIVAKRRETGPKLLLITNKKNRVRAFRWDENYGPWINLKKVYRL